MATPSGSTSPPSSAAAASGPGLARALLASGRVTPLQLDEAAQLAQRRDGDLLKALLDCGSLGANEAAQAIAAHFSLPCIDLGAFDAATLPQGLLEPRLCLTHRVLVLQQRQGRLVVATADPSNRDTAERIKFATQSPLEWVVAPHDQLTDRLQRWASAQGLSPHPGAAREEVIRFDGLEAPTPAGAVRAEADRSEVDDAPVVRFLHQLLTQACRLGASDLHFEPYENHYRVRLRIDGRLQEHAAPPAAIKDRLASRIKVVARLDIAERRLPQDGSFSMRIDGKPIELRVSTLPTLFGEKVVIRLLDPAQIQLGIDALGFDTMQRQQLLEAIGRPHGMVLVTGPTGSGKTVSLYSCLSLLNRPNVNISTAEDPAEIPLEGINQVSINDKTGLDFATALRSFLRQDPDIIMVGEIRDLETADMAIKAAQTGHLVLSTLHTNDAPSTLTRLRHMGVAPFNIASSVTLITAQRLVRRLCERCKQPAGLPAQALVEAGFAAADLDGSWQPYRPVGCPACQHGWRGRIGVHQVMPISPAIEQLVLNGSSATEIAVQASREGVRTLRESGLQQVRLGLTSLEEVLAATEPASP